MATSDQKQRESNVGATTASIHSTNRGVEYECFDSLPRELRDILNYLPARFGADQVAEQLKAALADRWTPQMYASWVSQRATALSERDLRAAYPPGYPIFSRTRTLR